MHVKSAVDVNSETSAYKLSLGIVCGANNVAALNTVRGRRSIQADPTEPKETLGSRQSPDIGSLSAVDGNSETSAYKLSLGIVCGAIDVSELNTVRGTRGIHVDPTEPNEKLGSRQSPGIGALSAG